MSDTTDYADAAYSRLKEAEKETYSCLDFASEVGSQFPREVTVSIDDLSPVLEAYREATKEAKELQATLTGVEAEVSEVYYYLTNGKFSKANTSASVILDEFNERIGEAEVNSTTYHAALTALSEIRETWVRRQTINWSGDIYPLVAILNAALNDEPDDEKRGLIEKAIAEHRHYWRHETK